MIVVGSVEVVYVEDVGCCGCCVGNGCDEYCG